MIFNLYIISINYLLIKKINIIFFIKYMENNKNLQNNGNNEQIQEDNNLQVNNENNQINDSQDNFNLINSGDNIPEKNEVQTQIENQNQEAPPVNINIINNHNENNNIINNNENNNIINNNQNRSIIINGGENNTPINNNIQSNINNINNQFDIINENRIKREEEDRKVAESIKTKIKFLQEKYNFSLQFSDIILKIVKSFHDLTYSKLFHSIKESLNFITFFKESSELYAKFAKQIKETNNIIMSSNKEEKLNDDTLHDVMQKTQNILFQNITKISTTMKQNIINKGPLSKLQEKINKIEQIKKENFNKIRIINDSKNILVKNMKQYDKLFKSYLPDTNLNMNNLNAEERPSLIDSPDFIIIIRTLLGDINKLILDVNLFIIDTKDTFYRINGLYVEINNLVKDAILIYIQECKTIFNLELTKNFEEIENYYKKLDDKSSDKMFKLKKIFSTKENEDYIYELLQQYYIILSNSNCIKKDLLKDRNTFSLNYTSNIFLFFEWLVSVSPQPSDISIKELLIKQLNLKRDPGIFSFWKECIFMFTKQHHLLVFDKPGTIGDLVNIFELDKISFRRKTEKKNKFLFELIAIRKGKIMDFKGTFSYDALDKEKLEEIMNLVYSS